MPLVCCDAHSTHDLTSSSHSDGSVLPFPIIRPPRLSNLDKTLPISTGSFPSIAQSSRAVLNPAWMAAIAVDWTLESQCQHE